MKNFAWLILLGLLYFGWQAGWFNGITEYFSEANKQARQEKVIYHEDGSYDTVKYRNVIDLLLGK